MPTAIQQIVEDNGISILVDYVYQIEKPYCVDVDNPATLVEGTLEVELREVEIEINGEGVSVLHLLNESQKDFIISKLSYGI